MLVSNHELWRQRTHPRIDHELLDAEAARPRLRSSLRFRRTDLLGRSQRKAVHGTDTIDDAGHYTWRGDGVLRVVECRWSVPLVDPGYRWAVVWLAAARFGPGPGLAIHTRDPCVSQALLDEILVQIHAHPFLAARNAAGERRSAGLYATVQDWIPPQPYTL